MNTSRARLGKYGMKDIRHTDPHVATEKKLIGNEAIHLGLSKFLEIKFVAFASELKTSPGLFR